MFRANTLRKQIVWSLIPTFCALFVLLGLVDLYRQKRLVEEELRARAKSVAENFAYSSRLAVLTEDWWLLDAALQSVIGSADFAYVWIYGDKWKTLAHVSGRGVDLAKLKPELDTAHKPLLIRGSGLVLSDVSTGKESFIEHIVPITSIQSTLPYELQIGTNEVNPESPSQTRERTIGAVRLGLSRSRVEEQVASFLIWRGWSLLVFLGLTTFAIYFFSDRITRPIKQLTERAKQMSKERWSEEIPVESRDEVGQLASSFNEMAWSLSELYAGLEHKVAERTNELRAANIKLAEASQHKSRFLANVNHELRTPLSSIIGYARLLRRETEGQISSSQRENLDDLLRNAERLLGMIDSLLNFAKIESGKMEVQVEPVRVDELIQNAVSSIEAMLDPKAVRLVRDVPEATLLHTDPEKLHQIVINLLGNAAKFTERGEIRVSVRQLNGDFKLAVADSGIGIDKVDVGRIFEEFDRGRLTNNGQYHGTGLGLTIVKRLVDLLGGSVEVESEVGQGSTFTVTLPVRQQGSSERVLNSDDISQIQ